MIGKELEISLGLVNCSLKYLSQSIQSCNYSASNNYQVLECVGDSILKFVTSLIIYNLFGCDHDEAYLTNKRTECNYPLSPSHQQQLLGYPGHRLQPSLLHQDAE